MKIEMRPIGAVKPYEQNPRVNDQAVDAVAASLREFGWRQPIVVDANGVIIVGHTRLKAAQKLGLTEVPVHVATDLTPEKIKAYRLADNRLGELAEWNMDLLQLELKDLQGVNFDLDLLGFGSEEIEKLLGAEASGNPGLTDPDEIPEPPKEPVAQIGDLWELGEHRLLCGSAVSSEDVDRLLNNAIASAVITDPPYGVSYVGKTADALPVHNDGKETLLPLLTDAFRIAFERCLPGAVWYVSAPAGPQFYDFASVLKSLEIWRQTLVWAKQTLVMGHSDYHYQHEAIFYGWKPGAAHKSPPDRKQTTLWFYDRPTASPDHPTMKPVGLFAKMIENSTVAGDVIYEPFCGSGTTLIAAERLGRRCFGLEISPQYCDVIIRRWAEYTGKQAKRIATDEKTPASTGAVTAGDGSC